MAKFLAYYNLCPIHDPKEFLGIAQDRDKANIIATLGKNIVMIIKISTQKQVRSWSVVEKLSSKVVYDLSSQKYVGVFANRILRCWDETSTDINKCKKIKFQKSIADLISNDGETYVLYSDGKCEKLVKAIQSRKAEKDPSQTRNLASVNSFSDSNIILLPSGYHILTYFNRHNDTGELELVRVPLESGNPSRFSVKRENMNVRVAGYAVIEGDEAPLLLTIWSDKRLFLLNLTDMTMPEDSPGDFVSMLTPLDVENPLSVLGISKHFVAIYGANSGQDGVSLLLYNTQFKLIKARQYFKVYFNFSRLWAMGNYILLAMGQNLSVVSYQMSKELLAELVGTQANNDYQALVEYINEEEALQECLQYESSHGFENRSNMNEAEESNQSSIVESSNVEADGKLQPFEGVSNFDCALNSLSKLHMRIDLERPSSGFEDVQIHLMAYVNDNSGTIIRDIQMIVHHLEQCGASEHEITEKVLPMLIKMDLMQDIVLYLRRYTNISEKTLAKTLSYALNKVEEAQIQSIVAAKVNGSNGFDDLHDAGSVSSTAFQTTDVLNAVLSCSFDPTAIAVHIRHDIDYQKVLILLGHLYKELDNPKGTREEGLSFEPLCVELQLLRWFGVCLNAHFQKLALSKEVPLMELLLKWNRLFAGYKTEVLELDQLSSLLYNIMRRKRVQKVKNYSKWYSVEEVILY